MQRIQRKRQSSSSGEAAKESLKEAEKEEASKEAEEGFYEEYSVARNEENQSCDSL